MTEPGSRQAKHMTINAEICKLELSVQGLRDLLSEVKGDLKNRLEPDDIKKEPISLSNLLSLSTERLGIISKSIQKILEELKTELF